MVQGIAAAAAVPRGMLIADAWAQLGDAVAPLSNTSGRPLARTVKLLLDPLVLRPAQHPRFAGGVIGVEHVDALRRAILDAGPALAATAAWFQLVKKARRRAGVTEGHPQDLYFQRCFELAHLHGDPKTAPDAARIAAETVADVHTERGEVTVDRLRRFVTDPSRTAELTGLLRSAWERRGTPESGTANPTRIGPPAPADRQSAADGLPPHRNSTAIVGGKPLHGENVGATESPRLGPSATTDRGNAIGRPPVDRAPASGDRQPLESARAAAPNYTALTGARGIPGNDPDSNQSGSPSGTWTGSAATEVGADNPGSPLPGSFSGRGHAAPIGTARSGTPGEAIERRPADPAATSVRGLVSPDPGRGSAAVSDGRLLHPSSEPAPAPDDRLAAFLDGCAAEPDAGLWDALAADRVGSIEAAELDSPGVARGYGLTVADRPHRPELGDRASKRSLPKPFDRSIMERLFAAFTSVFQRESMGDVPSLVRGEITRSAAPWQLATEPGRVTMALGRDASAGLGEPSTPAATSAGTNPDIAAASAAPGTAAERGIAAESATTDAAWSGIAAASPTTDANARLLRRWQRESYVHRVLRLPHNEAAPADLREDVRTVRRSYLRRLWARVHGRELRGESTASDEVWDLLDGVLRSVVMDQRDRLRRSLERGVRP
ncbi:hypothetical protein [Glycomyces paridis]|uniref:Uncharacterized protein n=1 Tax=Glycomyces paridis TaxID=2126555 RepID=A0A4S8NXP8_9ACTN|nr:hypothetical protein [Glycomyces paridis]THV21715.1 hypothetical protein E9998_24445 [Glycomyces paridis]